MMSKASSSALCSHAPVPAAILDIACCDALPQGLYRQAILGDLNTMAHGIARMSPSYCCDHMRLWSLGQPEALFWHNAVLCVPDPDYQTEQDGRQPKGGPHISWHMFCNCSCQSVMVRQSLQASRLRGVHRGY